MTTASLFGDARFPLGPFTPYENNPILRPKGDTWESSNLYNPAALVVDDRVVLLYRAHAEDIVSHVGIAFSEDGYHFEREDAPILSPEHDYERFGCEDPRIAFIEGTYYLTYTGWDRHSAQLCLATSPDLRDWTKHGPLFEDFDTFRTMDPRGHNWSKAGVIVPRQIDGRWWMYFGEGGIYWATSEDLIHWTPGTTDEHPMYAPTPGTWDEALVEIGSSPVLTDTGLLLMLTNGATRRTLEDGTREVDRHRSGRSHHGAGPTAGAVAAPPDLRGHPWPGLQRDVRGGSGEVPREVVRLLRPVRHDARRRGRRSRQELRHRSARRRLRRQQEGDCSGTRRS